MPRISALPSLTTVDGADEQPVVDVSASTTKKATKADYLKDAPTYFNASSIPNSAHIDNSITSTKIDLTSYRRFVAVPSGNQSIPATTNTKVLFQTEQLDQGGNYATSRYTAAVTGLYTFKAAAQFGGATRSFMSLYVNGVEVVRGPDMEGTASRSNAVSADLQLNATDYVEAYVFTSSAVTTSAALCRFTGGLM